MQIPGRLPEGREIAKTRPCVVISVSALNRARSTVIMAPLTSNGRSAPPLAISLPSAGKNTVVVCDQIFAVDKRRIRNKVGVLSQQDLAALEESLRIVLGL